MGSNARRAVFSLVLAACLPLSAAGGEAASGPTGTIAVTIGADLWLVSADGKQRTRLTRDGNARGSAWSPDGRRLLFAGVDGPLRVLRLDAARGQATVRLPIPRNSVAAATQPVWARDGRIAFVLSTGGAFSPLRPDGIWVANGDGSDVRQVLSYGSQPAWAPDGQRIAFTQRVGPYGESDVAVVSANGGEPRRLASGYGPAWSPDGRWIAFFDPAGRLRLEVAAGVRAAIERPIVVEAGRCGSGASWSPDSRWIAYSACPEGTARAELFVVAAAGGAPIRLLGARYYAGSAAWRPVEPSTGTVVAVRVSAGACAQRPGQALVTVTDRQRRPLARTRVVIRGGERMRPAAGVTGTAGRVTLRLVPRTLRPGPLLLTVTGFAQRPASGRQAAVAATVRVSSRFDHLSVRQRPRHL